MHIQMQSSKNEHYLMCEIDSITTKRKKAMCDFSKQKQVPGAHMT